MEDRKHLRGFASMDKARLKELASRGGKMAQQRKTAHRFTSEEATEAGKKGGQIVSQDRQHMSEIGKLGGTARKKKYDELC